MTVYDMIKENLSNTVPYARYTGVEIIEVSPEHGVTRLEKRDEVENHIQTVHAGALFTLGEAASGAAMAGLLGEKILSVRPVAAKADIAYLKTAKTDVTAKAKASISADAALAALADAGVVQFDVDVVIENADNTPVAEMKVGWHVRSVA